MGNKTGKYIWDSELKTFVKISDRPPSVSGRAYFPRDCGHSGHRFENLDKTFYSQKEKKDYMKKNNIAEAG